MDIKSKIGQSPGPLIVFAIMAIGAIVYFSLGVKVQIEPFLSNEESLRIEFNPKQKMPPPRDSYITITSKMESFQRLFEWLRNYDGKWYSETGEIPSNPMILIHGNTLRLDIFRHHFYLSGQTPKGYYRTYCGRDESSELLFLLDLQPANQTK